MGPKIREVNGPQHLVWVSWLAWFLSLLACPFLIMIAIYPIDSHFKTHLAVAKGYFIPTMFCHALTLYVYYKIYKSAKDSCKWKQHLRKWTIRRAILFGIAVPYLPHNLHDFGSCYITYEESMTRIEQACPGISERSLYKVVKYPWRRRNGKHLTDPYPDPLPFDEFERIPEGEPMEERRITALQSYAHCK